MTIRDTTREASMRSGPGEVRVVVVGDAGVGKSSLVAAAANEVWCASVPAVLPPAAWKQQQQQQQQQQQGPPGTADVEGAEAAGGGLRVDKFIDSVSLLIDTGGQAALPSGSELRRRSREQRENGHIDPGDDDAGDDGEEELSAAACGSDAWTALQQADAVVVCYSVPVAYAEIRDQPAQSSSASAAVDGEGRALGGIARLRSVWLPLVRERAPGAPVVLAGTRLDEETGAADSERSAPARPLEEEAADGGDADADSGSGGEGSRRRDSSDAGSSHERIFEELVALPLIEEFTEVETCLECSSKTLQQVHDVFYHAHKAVVHPSAPLLDPEQRALRKPAVRALAHVFHAFDRDEDDCLSDAELNGFQVSCFNAPLQEEELRAIKRVVKERMPRGITTRGGRVRPKDGKPGEEDRQAEDGSGRDASASGGGGGGGGATEDEPARGGDEEELITLSGFLFLHSLFLERGRTDITWTVLRKFGYTNALTLKEDLPQLEVPRRTHGDQVCELSDECVGFLRHTFEHFDRDRDGMLTPLEMSELFFTLPKVPWEGEPWEAAVETGMFGSVSASPTSSGGGGRPQSPAAAGAVASHAHGRPARLSGLTWKGFLAQWCVMTMLSPKTSLRSLYCLGYHGVPGEPLPHGAKQRRGDALVMSQRRASERRRGIIDRMTLTCWVIGSEGSGKTEIMQGLAGRAFGATRAPAGPSPIDEQRRHRPGGSPAPTAGGPCRAQGEPASPDASRRGPASGRFAERLPQRDSVSRSGSVGPSGFYDTPWSADIVEYENRARVLCMREVRHCDAADMICSSDALDACDVVLFVFDATSDASFEYMTRSLALLEGRAAEVPVLIAAAKDDLMGRGGGGGGGGGGGDKRRAADVAALRSSFYAAHDIALVLPISMRTGDTASCYLSTVMVAMHPELAIPETTIQRDAKQYRAVARRAMLYTIGSVVLIAGVSLAWVYISQPSSSATQDDAGEGEVGPAISLGRGTTAEKMNT